MTTSRNDSDLERQNFLVDAVEVVHGDDPRAKAGHVAANLLRRFQIEIFHAEVRNQQFGHLFVDHVLRELQKVVEEIAAAHHLPNHIAHAEIISWWTSVCYLMRYSIIAK